MNRILYFVLLSFLLLTSCAESNGSTTLEPVSTSVPVPAEYAGKRNPFGPEVAAEGAEIFRTNCETCHGPQGHGDGPIGESLDPRPQNLAGLQRLAGDDYLFWRISEGTPGTSMVAWKGILTEEQIWKVVSFIRTLE
jgi:mono/diheme cytochrome c family protein